MEHECSIERKHHCTDRKLKPTATEHRYTDNWVIISTKYRSTANMPKPFRKAPKDRSRKIRLVLQFSDDSRMLVLYVNLMPMFKKMFNSNSRENENTA